MLEPMAPARTRGRALRILFVLLLVLLLLLAGAFGFYLWATGASGPTTPVTITIPEGATSGEMARLLEEAGVIRSPLMFRLMVRIRGIAADVQAGDYALTTNMRLSDALDVLEAGPLAEELPLSVTIPEGWRIEQVAQRVAKQLGVNRKVFLKQATSGKFRLPPYLPDETGSVEGFLFPKTYDFPEDVKARAVIDRLLAQFEAEVAGLSWDRAEQLGVSEYEVVIVASLIEREARIDADRRKIAAVIYNRLEREMALEIDATVQYALPEHKERLTFKDLEYESPYNTYLHPGLPPGPIASPGRASIQAALNPADADWLYYVLIDPETGEHAFAETYEEFLEYRDQAGLG